MPTDRTLILGSLGRMGRRYTTIARYLGKECDGWDIASGSGTVTSLHGYTHVIIATPTDKHADWLRAAIVAHVPYVLCEKPMCMNSAQCDMLEYENDALASHIDIRIVCNWSYVFPWRLKPGKHDILYGNWMTGPHGVDWDCCQLHYLARGEATLFDDAPAFFATIDGCHNATLSDIDNSYIAMLHDWYESPARLWDIQDAVDMERKVEDIIQCRKAGE